MIPNSYPKRLIEVDIPIARISENARKDKFGSISALHIWWARRPLAACRAVACAALWPDPADPLCPQAFIDAAVRIITTFVSRVVSPFPTHESLRLQNVKHSTAEGLSIWKQWSQWAKDGQWVATGLQVRTVLLNFIAEFSIRENSTVAAYLETSRQLTEAAHQSLGGAVGTRPLIADPFAGGGAIPLEAMRIGADVFASDLNPVPVLLNRVIVEYIPRFRNNLARKIREWGAWVGLQLQSELAGLYPKFESGEQPVSYLWARTIQCDGPKCGVEIPMLRSLWLARKGARAIALKLVPNRDEKRIDLIIISRTDHGWVNQSNAAEVIKDVSPEGTVRGGCVTCPCCGYTTPVARVREQLIKRSGASRDSRMVCVITAPSNVIGKQFHLPTSKDLEAAQTANTRLEILSKSQIFGLSAVPDEPTPVDGTGSKGGGYRTRKYGVTSYGHFFNTRQLVQHLTLSKIVRSLREACEAEMSSDEAVAVQTVIALTANRQIDRDSAFCRWNPQSLASAYTFGRQAIPMLWDFVESPALFAPGGWDVCIENTCRTIEDLAAVLSTECVGESALASASQHPLPDESCACVFTDPPYYDSVPYAELSDFFFVWLKRSLGDLSVIKAQPSLTRRDIECVVNLNEGKDKSYFQRTMTACLAEARRICSPTGLGVVVFAHKTTAGWETQLQAMIDAGWIVTASWPLDTEMAHRLRALNSAALTSSIHLVCRPRDSTQDASVGEWRDLLNELPVRIRVWMRRLADERVVGADAIFACLGPALEIYSRHGRVEKANGEQGTLHEYLESVWAAVSTEALSLIFADADADELEPDARLTAMWLWTLGGGDGSSAGDSRESHDDECEEQDESPDVAHSTSYVLEYDAARKIAQGLGISLDKCRSLVEIKGDKARLLTVFERVDSLFEKSVGGDKPTNQIRVLKQSLLFDDSSKHVNSDLSNSKWGRVTYPSPGRTVLDRVHQAMVLFAANRGDLLSRFLMEESVGRDSRFWKLADNLNKLFLPSTEERRWVEGLLARKKGLGL